MSHGYVTNVYSSRRRHVHRVFGGEHDDCCVCGTPTPFWLEKKDVPICLQCTDTAPYGEIPDKREWLVSQGFNLPKDWTPRILE